MDGPDESARQIHPDGSIVWRAEQPMGEHDRYVAMAWTDGSLTAGSGEFNVVLDPETGRILSKVFTK